MNDRLSKDNNPPPGKAGLSPDSRNGVTRRPSLFSPPATTNRNSSGHTCFIKKDANSE
jgi:hypothetical protein